MQPNIGLSAEQRKKVAHLLNALVADEYVLYTKTLNFHWNIQSQHFDAMHAFFKHQYETLFDFVDDVAERARALGEPAAGSLQEFLKLTRLKESIGPVNEQEMLRKLLEDHEAIIRTLRADLEACITEFGDAGTNNFLTDLMEKHEKMAWMLRSFLS